MTFDICTGQLKGTAGSTRVLMIKTKVLTMIHKALYNIPTHSLILDMSLTFLHLFTALQSYGLFAIPWIWVCQIGFFGPAILSIWILPLLQVFVQVITFSMKTTANTLFKIASSTLWQSQSPLTCFTSISIAFTFQKHRMTYLFIALFCIVCFLL